MAGEQRTDLDSRTLELIEAAFGDKIMINHDDACRLLGCGRAYLMAAGDQGQIGFCLIGKRQRRYSRDHIKQFLLGSNISISNRPGGSVTKKQSSEHETSGPDSQQLTKEIDRMLS